jgi:hypothetical protein
MERSLASGSGSGLWRISCDRARLLATHWDLVVNGTLRERRKPKCPRCGKRLVTDKAQQCFGCGLRWHGSPRPDARSKEFANWPQEKSGSFIREVIRKSRASNPTCISRRWELSVWRVLGERWREADAWAAAGVGSDDIRALKQLIKSSWSRKRDDAGRYGDCYSYRCRLRETCGSVGEIQCGRG